MFAWVMELPNFDVVTGLNLMLRISLNLMLRISCIAKKTTTKKKKQRRFLDYCYHKHSIAFMVVVCLLFADLPQAHPQPCKGLLSDVWYPFAIEGDESTPHSAKAASPYFLLSNCTSSNGWLYPHWDSLMTFSTNSGFNASSGPSVLSLDYKSSKVNLSWDVDQITSISSSGAIHVAADSCSISAYADLSSFLPISISFKNISNLSAIEVSKNTVMLLFNCSNSTFIRSTNFLDANSSRCQHFERDCGYGEMNCLEFTPQHQLMLGKKMEQADCSHFQFYVTHNPSLPVQQWIPRVFELAWINTSLPWAQECSSCNAATACGYEDDGRSFHCFKEHGSGNPEVKIIIASAVGFFLIAAIAAAAFILLYRRSRKKQLDSMVMVNKQPTAKVEGMLLAKLRGLFTSSKHDGRARLAREFSYQELVEATCSFAYDNMVGDGGFGAVYVGTLRDGQRVAIKKLFYANHRRMDQFYNEIHILSQLSHPNLVKLYGFCCQDERDLLLVFEYVPKGSLFDCLHDSSFQQQQQHPVGNIDGMKCWRIRLRIAWEIAEALQHLHNFASPPIFHRDVKTSNILLDDDFHAKLADFGISRFVPERAPHITTIPQGTPGYVDPEYHTCHRLTDKSDVFSFGVVLMELLSGRQAVDMFASSAENVNLFALTLRKVTDGTWHQLLDHSCWSSNHHCDLSVSGQQFEALHLRKLSSSDGETLGCSPLIQSDTSDYYENDVVKHLIELAFRCLQPASVDRPSMTYVAETLSNLCRGCGIVTSLHKPSTAVDQISGAAVMPPFRHNPSSSCSADSTISSKCGSSCSKSTTNSSLPPSPMYIDVNDTTHLIFKPEVTF